MGQGGFRNTSLELKADVKNLASESTQFGVEFLARFRLKDDDLERFFLEQSNITFLGSFYDTVGVQGSLRYKGDYDLEENETPQSSLAIEDLAFTVKLYEQVYISAIFNDVWDFESNAEETTPYSFQPEILVTWDRCCWALYGSWDTKEGAISITLTTPGATQGFGREFPSPFIIPRRAPAETEEASP